MHLPSEDGKTQRYPTLVMGYLIVKLVEEVLGRCDLDFSEEGLESRPVTWIQAAGHAGPFARIHFTHCHVNGKLIESRRQVVEKFPAGLTDLH